MNALAIARGGLAAASFRLDAAAGRIASAATSAEPDTEGLASDLVEQMQAGYAFDANLCVIRTADALIGSLLDVTA
jgi:flagellar basal body rod protein FlgC